MPHCNWLVGWMVRVERWWWQLVERDSGQEDDDGERFTSNISQPSLVETFSLSLSLLLVPSQPKVGWTGWGSVQLNLNPKHAGLHHLSHIFPFSPILSLVSRAVSLSTFPIHQLFNNPPKLCHFFIVQILITISRVVVLMLFYIP
jgi:hypothetical protein